MGVGAVVLLGADLLGFDTKGNGHAIVANGNPDTADHTAIYVPGTTSRLEGAGGDIGRMTRVWAEAHAMDQSQSVSTITWIGYDAPQNIAPEAMDDHWAYDGAPKLNRFLDGLQTAQGGPDASHTTVIGHSYGSTTVGAASMAQGGMSADDIVVAGSPGMLVGHANDLDVGKDHVWSEAATSDPVPAGGKVARLGGEKWDVETWNGIPFNAGYVQVIPSDEAFGAHRMDVDTSGHSDYWNENSQSPKNQAAVVVGRYDRVEEDD
ncbi:alpha/beta hydrolase [Streptomyces sp. NPDC017943]|uniref:alpha/beta hydrolase n=1 Tax=Streptomyces sp. NPDC017943 TaxID=3365019 RepID=UPI00378C33BE